MLYGSFYYTFHLLFTCLSPTYPSLPSLPSTTSPPPLTPLKAQQQGRFVAERLYDPSTSGVMSDFDKVEMQEEEQGQRQEEVQAEEEEEDELDFTETDPFFIGTYTDSMCLMNYLS